MSLRSQLHDHDHNPEVDDTLTETATNRYYGTFFSFCSRVKVCFPSRIAFLNRNYRRTVEPEFATESPKMKQLTSAVHLCPPLASAPGPSCAGVSARLRVWSVRTVVGAVQTRPGMGWAWSTESGAPIGRPRNRVSSKRVICYHGGETLAQTRRRKEHAAERRGQEGIVIRGIGPSRVVCTWLGHGIRRQIIAGCLPDDTSSSGRCLYGTYSSKVR